MKHSKREYSGILSTHWQEIPPRDEAQAQEWEEDSVRVKRWFDLQNEVYKKSRLCKEAQEVTGSAEKAQQAGELLGLPALQEELDRLEEEMEGKSQPVRSAIEWAFTTYPSDTSEPENYKLESGFLVTVFNTVSDADILFEIDEVKFDYTEYHHGYPEGFDKQEWINYFHEEWPAKLTRADGSVVYGSLEAFCETGTEGIIWSINDYSKTGYEALVTIKNGDHLQVFKNVRDGNVAWEGKLSFGPEEPQNTDRGAIMREPQHMSLEEWRTLSWGRNPAIIIPQPEA